VGIAFQQPAVWWAALLVSLPIAVHLLTRAKRTPLIFPSIRFLQETRLAAVSRSRPDDWLLLILRALTILLAVAACAGPILVTPAREAAWRARVARAVVLDDRTAAPDDEVRSAAVGAVFARARLRDALSDAVRWLDRQAPTTREIVVLSAFRRGATDAADFAAVPAHIGIRPIRSAGSTAVREREIARLTWRDGHAVRVTEQLSLTPAETEVREIRAEVLTETPIRVSASAADEPAAAAALRAVLRRGLRLPPAGLLDPIDVAWPGSVEQLAADLEARLAAPLDSWEPDRLPDEEVAALARPPAPIGRPTPVDAGDRRMAWALVIALLVAEHWMRRGAAWT
jgi:hypothetical protein